MRFIIQLPSYHNPNNLSVHVDSVSDSILVLETRSISNQGICVLVQNLLIDHNITEKLVAFVALKRRSRSLKEDVRVRSVCRACIRQALPSSHFR